MKTLDCLSEKDYRELGDKFKGHKSGPRIAIIMLKNASKKGLLQQAK